MVGNKFVLETDDSDYENKITSISLFIFFPGIIFFTVNFRNVNSIK